MRHVCTNESAGTNLHNMIKDSGFRSSQTVVANKTIFRTIVLALKLT